MRILSFLRRFRDDTRGNVTVETVIWVPFILALMGAVFSLHDAFQQKSLNVKAAHTIADALARQTDPVDNAYLDGMQGLLDFLTRSDTPPALRITLVRYDHDHARYRADWSQVRGDLPARSDADLVDLQDRLPELLPGERLILVETQVGYAPPLAMRAVDVRCFGSFVFARPRFAPQLVWAG